MGSLNTYWKSQHGTAAPTDGAAVPRPQRGCCRLLGRTHTIAGALAAAAVARLTAMPGEMLVPALAAGAAAGLLPDIDMPGSTAGRMVPGYRGLARGELPALLGAAALLLWAAPRFLPGRVSVPPTLWILPAAAAGIAAAMSFALREIVTHRGPTHSLAAAAAFTAAVRALWPSVPAPILWALAAGYLSHIVIDLFNPDGAAVLWPLSRRKWSVRDTPLLLPLWPLVVRTGGPGETYGWRLALMFLLAGVLVSDFAGASAPALHFLKGVR